MSLLHVKLSAFFASTLHTVEADSAWLEKLNSIIASVDALVWGVPLVVLLIGVGIFLSARLSFRHVLHVGPAFRYVFHRDEAAAGEVSAFKALCTALAGTIGTGNIVGVATAVTLGGPGALFWMIVAAFFGMATAYAEGVLAIRYRVSAADGTTLGGPFLYIERGLGPKWKPLAVLFAVFAVLAGLLGIGTLTQIHGITAAALRFFDPAFDPANPATGLFVFGTTYSWAVVVTGLVVTAAAAFVILGGFSRIANVASVIVPFMAAAYILFGLLLLVCNAGAIPDAIRTICIAAFDPQSVTGGAVGSLFTVIQAGVSRGIFSNEAGLGSTPIAASTSQISEPARQGFVNMTGPFLDTIVICSMTGLAIVTTGVWDPALGLRGVDVTIEAFARGLPFSRGVASFFLMTCLVFFAFSTTLAWAVYSGRSLAYLCGKRWGRLPQKAYAILYIAVLFIGPYLTVSSVWGCASIFCGLMAVPNLIALLLLSPEVVRLTREFFAGNGK